MTHPVDRALRLWTEPLAEGEDALLAFRSVYVDPLDVNGAQTALQELVDRARMLQQAFEGLRAEILERFATPERSAFAFRLAGLHVGRLTTPLGDIAPTGQLLDVLGMDIFAIRQDRVFAVWAVADYLGLLMRAKAVNLANA
jgi:predicted ester cyclase